MQRAAQSSLRGIVSYLVCGPLDPMVLQYVRTFVNVHKALHRGTHGDMANGVCTRVPSPVCGHVHDLMQDLLQTKAWCTIAPKGACVHSAVH